MAFDGMTVAALVWELQRTILGGRIAKIAQPEPDELLFTIKKEKEQYLLLASAGAGLPLIYLTDERKNSPMTAPNFCMLLRKHLQGGQIMDISQPGLERVICIEIEHRNELGDLCTKRLRMEIMGKHSNIIFCDDHDRIIDSIKHVSAQVSSVREVLPGRAYFIPQTQNKTQPVGLAYGDMYEVLLESPMPVPKALYTSFVGISPVMAREISYMAGVESEVCFGALAEGERAALVRCLEQLLGRIADGEFCPCIIYDNGQPVEFAPWTLTQYEELECEHFESISGMLSTFYQKKNRISRIRQRSADLRHIVQTALDRNIKKYDLQERQLRDTEKMDKYRVYGELLNTYGYSAKQGDTVLEAENFYTGEMVRIPLDPQLTPSENARRYFDRYGKLKRTKEALSKLVEETRDEIRYLESVLRALEMADSEEDLLQIREELAIAGYVRRKAGMRKPEKKSKPYHFLSSDGFDIYVGRNNLQNDELTFKVANGGDWWFHAKKMAGSHVIVKTRGEEISDRTFEEAASLAAHFSQGKGNVEVDYVQRKHVKKPNGAKPGFVVYYTNYSMMASSNIDGLRRVDD